MADCLCFTPYRQYSSHLTTKELFLCIDYCFNPQRESFTYIDVYTCTHRVYTAASEGLVKLSSEPWPWRTFHCEGSLSCHTCRDTIHRDTPNYNEHILFICVVMEALFPWWIAIKLIFCMLLYISPDAFNIDTSLCANEERQNCR